MKPDSFYFQKYVRTHKVIPTRTQVKIYKKLCQQLRIKEGMLSSTKD